MLLVVNGTKQFSLCSANEKKNKMLLFMWIKQLVGLKYLIFLFHFFIFYEFFM